VKGVRRRADLVRAPAEAYMFAGVERAPCRFFWQRLTLLTFNEDMQQNCYLSVVVPLYNEEATVATVIQQLVKLPGLLEIVVVDDCSSDRTPHILQELANQHPPIVSLRHKNNKGKTAALKTAPWGNI
jgi:cellulose synthase/poly-beta-1,6-N-acetylglucosamine synthase-like glycosyltransferase